MLTFTQTLIVFGKLLNVVRRPPKCTTTNRSFSCSWHSPQVEPTLGS